MMAEADCAEMLKALAAFKVEVNERIEGLARTISHHRSTLVDHGERLDDHDRKFVSFEDALRTLRTMGHQTQADVFRLADAATVQGAALERLAKNTSKILELLQPTATL